ncbi:hypothetical protein JTB14_013385 [Gonioctena quinquepunctata]|nr:hypothetical protein JTB14_013385 [Gonioctena quinquepunctata]
MLVRFNEHGERRVVNNFQLQINCPRIEGLDIEEGDEELDCRYLTVMKVKKKYLKRGTLKRKRRNFGEENIEESNVAENAAETEAGGGNNQAGSTDPVAEKNAIVRKSKAQVKQLCNENSLTYTEDIRSKCQEPDLEWKFCIDEQIVPFKGKLNVKQYIRGKPCPWGMKVFALCGKSGLLYDSLIYQGVTTELNDKQSAVFGLGASTVMELQFTAVASPKNIYAAGTARIDRFRKPTLTTDEMMEKQTRGTSKELITQDGEVIVTKWYDNKPVIMASNFVSVGNVDNC